MDIGGVGIYNRRRIMYRIILVIVVAICVFAALYFVFFYSKLCNDYSCFQTEMIKCSKAMFINDAPDASWRYQIIGDNKADKSCQINVKLLMAKQGSLGLDKLQGYQMDCFYPLGVPGYPEKNLENCHGRLKEELQGIIITKLHGYILENIGNITEDLTKFS